jgi:O-acetylserine/cysteine efflux transporter
MWMSVVPPLPMFLLSWLVEGPSRIAGSFTDLTSRTGLLAVGGLVYTCLLATVVGTGIWTWLMARHPASTVAPFSMLVPITGLTTAWMVLGEQPSLVEGIGCAVVVLGVLLTTRGRLLPAPGARRGSRRRP